MTVAPGPGQTLRSDDPVIVSETTRYLCGAAYLDRRFADHVVTRVLREKHRSIAPSYGVDIAPVIRHCLAARRRRLFRDAVLSGVLFVLLPILLTVGVTLTGGLIRVVLAAWGVVFASRFLDRYEVLASCLLRNRFDPVAAPAASSEDEKRIRQIQHDQQGNITVYSGFSPFVGSGIDQGGWSFVVDMRKGKDHFGENLKPSSFEVEEVYDFVKASLARLQIGLRVEDRVYVSGRDVRDEQWVLPTPLGAPRAWIKPSIVGGFVRATSLKARHYLTVQIADWRGELILSIFLRFRQVGGNLFCEANYFLLHPLRSEYYRLDDIRTLPDVRSTAKILLYSLIASPFVLIMAPLRLLRVALKRITRWLTQRLKRRTIRYDPTFDFGAATSVREAGMATSPRHYFQVLDRTMYVKLIEKQILEAIVTFLDRCDIDTNDIRQRQTTILNTGVIMSGGSITAQSIAVGVGARARAVEAVRNVAPHKANPQSAGSP